MGARRLLALIEGLPLDAAVWTQHGWTVAHELAATQIELADMWGRLSVIAAGRGHITPDALPKPPEINHPGRPEHHAPKREMSDKHQIRNFFARR